MSEQKYRWIKDPNSKWTQASILVNGESFKVQMMCDELPNETYGIAGGRIVKLYIFNNTRDLLWYDRDWCKKPDQEVKAIYEQIVAIYN